LLFTPSPWGAPQDDDSARAIYGRDRSFQAILSRKVRAPKSTMAPYENDCRTNHAATIAEAKPDKE